MRYLIDTDIIVDFLRGRDEAVAFLEQVDNAMTSTITIAELHAGARTVREENRISEFLKLLEAIPLNAEIARTAGRYRHKYGPSHGSGLADCIIAASAFHLGATIATRNLKHFPMLKSVIAPYA